MSWLVDSLKSGVKNFLTLEANPNKVLEVNTTRFDSQRVHCREESLVLYMPTKVNEKFEIVLNRPCSETLSEAYSLCRIQNLPDAELRFILYKDKVPALVTSSRELGTAGQIQTLCDTIQEHPTWTLAHLCVALNLLDGLTNPFVLPFINSEDISDGVSPLQLAVQGCNIKAVNELLKLNASLDHFDHQLNSVLHFAASTNKIIVATLCDKSKNTINSRNGAGHTPLHVACLADRSDCVEALLEAGADVNICATQKNISSSTPGLVGNFLKEFSGSVHLQDMKFGGTPLHWSCSRQVIDTLVERGCDINCYNFDQRTALHIMVLRNRLECVVALLSHVADCNIRDKDGQTPLHLAVKEGKETIVKALIVFGADLSLVDNSGQLPRHGIVCESNPGDKLLYILHSVGAPRCSPQQTGCNRGCKHDENYQGVPPPTPLGPENRDIIDQMVSVAGRSILLERQNKSGRKSNQGGRLLCLDGGGIRGLILVVVLLEIEKALKQPLVHCFDWIAGTSTGGIVGLGLAAGRSLQECLSLYFKMKEVAFSGKRPYTSEGLESILQQTLGTETTMADVVHPKLIITGVLADRQPVDLHIFRNYESPSRIMGIPHTGSFAPPSLPEEQYVWLAARATGAAPTYFRSSGRFIDGGLIANNPTLDALTEIHEYNLALQGNGRGHEVRPVTVVVSIGTGVIPVTPYEREMDVFRPDSLWDAGKLMFGISALGKMLIDQATQADGRVVHRARSWCSMIGVPYFRFSPQLSEDIAMDEKSDQKLINMLWETKAYMHSNRLDVADMVQLLTETT